MANERLPMVRVLIALLGLVPVVVITALHPGPTLTESLADTSPFGVAIVGLLYSGSALLELLVLNRIEGVLGAAIYMATIYTALDYEDCDWLCVTHRGSVIVLFAVEACLLYTRNYGWLVLLGESAIVAALLVVWAVDDEQQSPWFGALELLALASARLLAAQTPVNTGRSAWSALLARPRRLVEGCIGEVSFEGL